MQMDLLGPPLWAGVYSSHSSGKAGHWTIHFLTKGRGLCVMRPSERASLRSWLAGSRNRIPVAPSSLLSHLSQDNSRLP